MIKTNFRMARVKLRGFVVQENNNKNSDLHEAFSQWTWLYTVQRDIGQISSKQ